MIINGVLVMDEPVAFDRIRAILQRRLLPIPASASASSIAEGDPYWEEDRGFRSRPAPVYRMALPPPGDDSVLREVISDLMSEPFDLDRPLWSFHLLEGYKGQGSIFMGRLHHCIGDGMALLLVLLSLTDVPAGGRGSRQPVHRPLPRSAPGARGRQATRRADHAGRHPPDAAVGRGVPFDGRPDHRRWPRPPPSAAWCSACPTRRRSSRARSASPSGSPGRSRSRSTTSRRWGGPSRGRSTTSCSRR